MTIVTISGKYYIPVTNGFQEITKGFALELYENGEVMNEIDLSNEID